LFLAIQHRPIVKKPAVQPPALFCAVPKNEPFIARSPNKIVARLNIREHRTSAVVVGAGNANE
jgi:hypothetical protein